MKFRSSHLLSAIIAVIIFCGFPLRARAQAFTTFWSGTFTTYMGNVAWGDYDGDGDLDLLFGNTGLRLFSNNTSTLTEVFPGLPSSGCKGMAWGDYDGDGDLDVLVAGDSGSTVYRNNGGTFSDIAAGMGVCQSGDAAWADLDNDGDLDAILNGYNGSADQLRIYYQNAGTFVDSGTAVAAGASNGSLDIADYDNDGDMDILVSNGFVVTNNGAGSAFTAASVFAATGPSAANWGDYDSDGEPDILSASSGVHSNTAGAFTQVATFGAANAGAGWGDYDNDGDLDAIYSGDIGIITPSYVTRVMRNDSGSFSLDAGPVIASNNTASLAWGDADNDGDLDLALTGGTRTRVYANPAATANTPPTAPTGLSATPNANHSVTFSWNASTDDHTPAAGLTYNLRVGTTPGACDIMSPHADATGFRRLSTAGNVGSHLSWTLRNLTPGQTYYWSVQAIDNSFKGGSFPTEQSTVAVPVTVSAIEFE